MAGEPSRFYLMYSPRWLFLLPGLALMLLGTIGYCLALPAVHVGRITFDAHTLLVSTLLLLMGAQAVWFAVAAKVFAVSEGLLPAGVRFEKFFSVATLERAGTHSGASSFIIGASLLVWAVARLGRGELGPSRLRLDHAHRHPRLHARGARIPDDPFQLLRQYSRYEAQMSTPTTTSKPAEFDGFAADYDAALNKGISLSGEAKDYFIEGRIAWLRRCLDRLRISVQSPRVLDFGCGTGAAFSTLRRVLDASAVIGIDVSAAELEIAHRENPWAQTYQPETTPDDLSADIAYSNGTFHHIPPADRPGVVARLHRQLAPAASSPSGKTIPGTPARAWS